VYVYDLRALDERISELRAATAGARADLYFATMANDRPRVLATIAAAGVGACVNSREHLRLALRTGFAPERIQFTSTGMSGADMNAVRQRGIRVNLDSLTQLKAWLGIGAREAGVRVNAAALLGRRDGDRIGMEPEQVLAAVALAARTDGRVNGLHVYVGTNFQSHEPMIPMLGAFFDLAARLPHLEYVNIGGGVGVDYAHDGPGFNLAAFGGELASLAGDLRARVGHDVRLVFEPGRALVASSGVMVSAITDVKSLNARRFVTVDASVAIFPRPLLHPDTPHRIRSLSDDPDGDAALVVGRTTYSRDILGSVRTRRELHIGELLVFDDAGAYCQSMASRFLGQADPAEVYLSAAIPVARKAQAAGASMAPAAG
jgi:diaminopimelate decarboxylase